MTEQSIATLFERYKEQRLKAEIAVAEGKKQNKILGAIQFNLVEKMLAVKQRSIGTEDDVFLSTRRHFGFSNTEENREEVRQYLINETGDDAPFMQNVVSRSALEEFMKERVEKQGKVAEDFPDFLKVNLHPGVTVQGWKQWKQKRSDRDRA